jgi:hypothetical protein
LLLTVGAVSIAILGWAQWWRFVIALLVLAVGVASAAYIVGTATSRGRRDMNAAPDPVETATRA